MRATWVIWGVLGVVLVGSSGSSWAEPPDKAETVRNPFDQKDVPDPDGKDVQDFAATVTLSGDDKDANAEQWVTEAREGKKGSLDGSWAERWNVDGGDWQYGTGRTQIKVRGDRVYMLVNSSNGRFLIDLKRDKKRLAGRYQGIDHPGDTGPCVFLIVDDERVDGNWSGHGRWDLRRKLK
jgi:hypothetical protein